MQIYLTKPIILIIILFFVLVSKTFMTANVSLVGGQWFCDFKKVGFATNAYSKYAIINETMAYTFTSKSDFYIQDRLSVKNKNGQTDTAEFLFVGKYTLNGNSLSMTFNNIIFTKKHPDAVINNDQLLYKDFTINYKIEREDNFLYLYSANNIEGFNHICWMH